MRSAMTALVPDLLLPHSLAMLLSCAEDNLGGKAKFIVPLVTRQESVSRFGDDRPLPLSADAPLMDSEFRVGHPTHYEAKPGGKLTYSLNGQSGRLASRMCVVYGGRVDISISGSQISFVANPAPQDAPGIQLGARQIAHDDPCDDAWRHEACLGDSMQGLQKLWSHPLHGGPSVELFVMLAEARTLRDRTEGVH